MSTVGHCNCFRTTRRVWDVSLGKFTMVSQPIDFGWLVVRSGSINLLLFESLIDDWLKLSSQSQLMLRLSWTVTINMWYCVCFVWKYPTKVSPTVWCHQPWLWYYSWQFQRNLVQKHFVFQPQQLLLYYCSYSAMQHLTF